MMTFTYGLFILLTLVLTALIGYTTFLSARLLQQWRPTENLLLDPLETAIRLCLIVVCVGLGLLSGLPATQLGWTAAQPWAQVGAGFVFGGLLALFFALTTRWLIARSGTRFYSPLVIELIAPTHWAAYALSALAMIPVVLVEELLFRSLLIGGFSVVLAAPLLVVLVGVLFGLLHLPQGLWGMAGAGLAGILMGGLFLAAGSLLLPVVAHYVANMAQLALVLVMRKRRVPPYTAGSSPPVG